MGFTKRWFEDLTEKDSIYPDDLDRDYDLWIAEKELEDSINYINYEYSRLGYEEMLGDIY